MRSSISKLRTRRLLTHTIKKRQHGAALIEGLLAMFIFMVGILGLIGLQANLQAYNTQAAQRLEVARYAQEMTNLVITDSENINCYANLGTSCSDTTADAHITQWNTSMQNHIPNATVTTNYDSTSKIFTITITWKRQQEVETHTYSMMTRVGV